MSILTTSKKKRSKAYHVAEGDESGLFYVNEAMKKSQEGPHTALLQRMTIAKNTYESITGDKINDYDSFQSMVADPAGYWRKNKIENNVETKEPVTIQFINAGYDIDFLEEKIKLPENFNDIGSLCARLRDEKNLIWENYTFDGETFNFSNRLKQRFINKVYYFAPQPLQKRRLALFNKFQELINEWEDLFRDECKEAGVKEVKIERAVASKRFIGPLPYVARLSNPGGGWYSNIEPSEVLANEDFIVKGHALYAEQIGLAELRPSVVVKKGEDKTRYKRYFRTDNDGGRRPYYVKKGNEPAAYWGMWRDAHVVFDEDHEFVIRDGRFVLAED